VLLPLPAFSLHEDGLCLAEAEEFAGHPVTRKVPERIAIRR